MPEGKRKFIEDAALVIDGRIAALKREYEEQPQARVTGDRSAILEAEFCAKLIRKLADAPYRGDPYKTAWKRWAKG